MIPYEKISLISEKEHNKVWLASTNEPDNIIVVKEISHANTDILKSISSIDNAHIPHILCWETKNKLTTVVEEYVSGLPLNTYIRKNKLTEQEIIKLFLQICEGIKVLHNQSPSIIHRDLKPSNILVSSDGIVKIIDFDAARKYNETADTDTCHLGTAAFASPEHYGYSQTDARSDIYSLGAVMYEIFSGRQLPKVSAEKNLTAEELYDSSHRPSKKLIQIIAKCTMFNPSARYQNIEELQHALKSYTNRHKKRFVACLIAAPAAFTLIGSFILLSGKAKNTVTSAMHTVESDANLPADTTPLQNPTATEETNPVVPAETPSASVTDKTGLKSKKTSKKENTSTTEPSIPVSSRKTSVNVKNTQKNQSKKTNKTSQSQNTKNNITPENPKTTASPEKNLVPVTVDFSGKTSYYIDTYNKKTGQSEMFTFYYLTNNPSLTPIHFACDLLTSFRVKNVYLQDTEQGLTYAIPAKYWSFVYDHMVKISDQYLTTLKLNNGYKIVLDCGNAIIKSKLRLINNLQQVDEPFNQFVVSPGCMEYSYKNPASMTLALINGYGRKITKITIPSLGKTISSKYYSIDSKNRYITFEKSFFKDFSDGENISLRIYHSRIEQINDDGYTTYTFLVK